MKQKHVFSQAEWSSRCPINRIKQPMNNNIHILLNAATS